jgi:hypothetical protein
MTRHNRPMDLKGMDKGKNIKNSQKKEKLYHA